MSSFTEEAIAIIRSVLRYKEKHGNDDAIKAYYQTYGTFNGLVEYLDSLESSKENNSKK